LPLQYDSPILVKSNKKENELLSLKGFNFDKYSAPSSNNKFKLNKTTPPTKNSPCAAENLSPTLKVEPKKLLDEIELILDAEKSSSSRVDNEEINSVKSFRTLHDTTNTFDKSKSRETLNNDNKSKLNVNKKTVASNGSNAGPMASLYPIFQRKVVNKFTK
jgi:hypothetical protein